MTRRAILAGAAVVAVLVTPDLPAPVTNNAVAAGRVDGTVWVFSALGVDASRRWSGITTRAAAWHRAGGWRSLPAVPGPRGRLAATAQVVRGRLFVFGGYTVDSSGAERSLANVDIYDPRTNRWSAGANTPVAVDDAVSGVYRDSLVYLVSGWHDTGNVQDVQVYDVVLNTWVAATPVPGPGVFGHTGGLSGNTIVFIDGAVKRVPPGPRYELATQSWVGTIDPDRPARIAWAAGPPHPGPPIYRAAAGTCGQWIVIAGGTDNPYNYDGIGYDGRPASPRSEVMAFDTDARAWRQLPPLPVATMDHRGLVVLGDTALIVGGMREAQRVSASIVAAPVGPCPR